MISVELIQSVAIVLCGILFLIQDKTNKAQQEFNNIQIKINRCQVSYNKRNKK